MQNSVLPLSRTHFETTQRGNFFQCSSFKIQEKHQVKLFFQVLNVTEHLADEMGFRYSKRIPSYNIAIYESNEEEDEGF